MMQVQLRVSETENNAYQFTSSSTVTLFPLIVSSFFLTRLGDALRISVLIRGPGRNMIKTQARNATQARPD